MDSSKRYSYNPTLHWNPQVEEYFINAYGAEHFDRISKALTRPSCYSCIRVNKLKSSTDAIIEKLKAILHEISLTSSVDTIRIYENGSTSGGAEDKGSSHVSTICKCQIPGLDYVVFVEGSGPYMVDYADAPLGSQKEVIVSRKCAESVLRGAQVFVPGVLACSAHVEKGGIVSVSVAVEQPITDGGWSVGITRGTVLQGLESDPQYFERSGMYIGQGITTMSRAGIFRASEGIAVEMTNRVFKLPSLRDVLQGEIFLQNLPSIITAHVLDPQEGERILDMCAAPGGKTTAIALLMRDKGEVIAVDRSHNKVMYILKLAREMGLSCISAYRLDALRSVSESIETVDTDHVSLDKEKFDVRVDDVGSFKAANENMINPPSTSINHVSNENIKERIYVSKAVARKNNRRLKNGPGRSNCVGGRVAKSKGFRPNSFDRVLLDAPCSALGLRPRLFAGEETIDSLRGHGTYQRRMFDQAVQLVRPGGVIVYSTCTINPGENEAVVRYALDTYNFLTLAPQNPRVGGPGLVGRSEFFEGRYIEEWLTDEEAELVQRFDPSSSLDTIGFFIAKFNVGQKDKGIVS
ncbi:hypothetical protein QJS04_geneDACA018667 [Acorus gramineus]|uniref:SAM-dependent MTase RsmB/NOP-type domain-containing protein n=1 Tax=Acorus gramineus TaxID=55184 RepID=A0AAV9A3R0_ACOGR|nr:hypothetical protein QJS04_geneDACA018667 [Acorus gramineus]